MSVGLQGNGTLSIKIDGKELPLSNLRFSRLLITSHMLYHCPMGELSFVDNYGLLAKSLPPFDGAPLTVSIGRSKASVKSYSFRIFNVKQQNQADGTQYTLSMISSLDKWRLHTVRTAEQGSSQAAITQIALACDLNFNGDATNDAQVWLPLNETYCKFARRIANHGYAGQDSTMLLGVTLDNELRYRNLTKIKLDKTVPGFTAGSENGIWVTSYELVSKSGLSNQAGGYGTTSFQFNPTTSEMTTADKVRTRRLSSALNVNSEAKTATDTGVKVVLPGNAGNTHSNSARAYHQNKRVKQLLSQSLLIVTPFDTKLDLFDGCHFDAYVLGSGGSKPMLNEVISGYYLIAGKTIFMSSDFMYYEKLALIRDGQNLKTTGGVV